MWQDCVNEIFNPNMSVFLPFDCMILPCYVLHPLQIIKMKFFNLFLICTFKYASLAETKIDELVEFKEFLFYKSGMDLYNNCTR